MVRLMPCTNPCRLDIHLAFTNSVSSSSIVWSKLGPAPPFPQMRVLEVKWSRALSLVCEAAFQIQTKYVYLLATIWIWAGPFPHSCVLNYMNILVAIKVKIIYLHNWSCRWALPNLRICVYKWIGLCRNCLFPLGIASGRSHPLTFHNHVR